jgi:hypothetical protein
MKTIIRQMLILALVAGVASASEEDYAPIKKIELTAKTTDNTFGTVVVQAETSQGQDGTGLSSLTVIAKSKTMSVPKDALAQASRANFMTTTLSSEVGYPDHGIGPYLYVCFLGHDGTKPCRYRLVFDAGGFKAMKKEDHPTTPRTVP